MFLHAQIEKYGISRNTTCNNNIRGSIFRDITRTQSVKRISLEKTRGFGDWSRKTVPKYNKTINQVAEFSKVCLQ